MKKTKIKNRLRFTLQGIIVLLLGYMLVRWGIDEAYTPDFEAYCPFGGLQALSSLFVRGSLACSMTSAQIVMGVVLLVGVVLFSKLFCGYICPLGTFSEWLGKIGTKYKIRREITGVTDKVLRSLKYVLLFLTFYFTLGSSELFCKNYDPFFATFTLFNVDVTVWMAILSIIVLVGGSILFRLFWCKYLCPLGAISNIFRFFILFAGVMGIYIFLILVFSLEISYVWPLAIITGAAYILEITKMESKIFPFLKITRNNDICNGCNICTKSCPQGIQVAEFEKVHHIDCNMCNECVNSCPKEGALTINNKSNINWLPATLVVILVVLGIYIGSTFRVATIDMRWVDEAKLENTKVYKRAGIKNIKCYGSAMAFARQMREVKGIYGIEAYADDHSIKLFYDPKIINHDKITEKLFSTSKVTIVNPDANEQIQVIKVGLLGFFDQFDAYYLKQLLMQYGDVYGFDTKWGEPVETHIYFSATKNVNLEELKEHIESETLTYSISDIEKTVPLNFEVRGIEKMDQIINTNEFNKLMYAEYFKIFNNRDRYLNDEIGIYKVEFELMDKSTSWVAYMQNHLSMQDTGVVAIHSNLVNENPYLQIDYVKSVTNEDKIIEMMNADSLEIHFRTGKVQNFANPFNYIQTENTDN